MKNNPLKFIDPTGLAAKEFVKAWDSYLEIKGKIYNWDGGYDWGFLLTDQETQMKVFYEFRKKESEAKKLHYDRNKYNTQAKTLDEIPDFDKWIRMSYAKSAYHQNTVKDGEKLYIKYVSPDGLQEVIYNQNTGKIVHDPIDVGTYNFFDPKKEGGLHMRYDVDPYEEWGNSPDDTSAGFWRSAVVGGFNFLKFGIQEDILQITKTREKIESAVNVFNLLKYTPITPIPIHSFN